MSDDTPTEATETPDEAPGETPAEAAPEATPEAESRPQRKPFRNKFSQTRISPESAERQGRVTMLAWRLLGGRDEAIAFLNNHDEALGGRPLDLAVASVEGCAAVEQAITARAGAAPSKN